jgi:prepilin-type N-terminal cleavage/methylation domain-containing protein
MVTRSQSGFSLVEIVLTVAILAVMFGLAAGVTMSTVNATRADGSTVSVLNILDLARTQATSERREMQLVFTLPNKIEIFRVEVPAGTTLVATRILENQQEFLKFTGVPDTPDAFGNASAIWFGATPTIRFTSDGSLLDSSGDPVNGSLFLGVQNKRETARAVTIFGATGLVRTWKWNGTVWVN